MAFEKGTQMGALKELKLLVQQREDSSGGEGPTQGKAQPGSQQPMPDGSSRHSWLSSLEKWQRLFELLTLSDEKGKGLG